MSKKNDEIVIATAALLGGNPVYYDYGHPERACVQQYWTIGLGTPEHPCSGPTAFGYTRADCAYNWLRLTHPEVEL